MDRMNFRSASVATARCISWARMISNSSACVCRRWQSTMLRGIAASVKRAVVVSLMGLLLSATTPVAAPPISDWSNIESVVVTAKRPGPALWHVVRGPSEVWILPTVEPAPSDLKWDSNDVARLLKGARVLLLPPRGQVGLFEGTWFLLTGLGTLELPEGQ